MTRPPATPSPTPAPTRLKILVIDEDDQRGQTLAAVLTATGYDVVSRAGRDAYLPSVVADVSPDLVLIEVASPDRDTLEQLNALHREHPRPVVMFAQDDHEDTIARAVRAGVSAYILDGLENARVKPIIDVAIAHFRHHQSLRIELDRASSALDDRKAIDRAKGLLMDRRGIGEPDAYALLRKLAMDRKARLGDIAREVLATAERLERERKHPS